MKTTASLENISDKIRIIRGHKAMLDQDLAALYRVTTRRLKEQVRRNPKRFPADFMFRLNKRECQSLRSQNATLENGRGRHSKYLPYAFTEQGVAMLSSVLNSERAIQVNVAVMRAFVRLRKFLVNHEELGKSLRKLEIRMNRKDSEVRIIFEAIRRLIGDNDPGQARRIGFDARN